MNIYIYKYAYIEMFQRDVLYETRGVTRPNLE